MTRPTGASSASRLGPGMETMELAFLPVGGWEGQEGSARTNKAALPGRWVISWEVGPGATVDRGLKLARLKLHCAGVEKEERKEQFIVGE